jgi:hypothetical protein
MAVGTTLAFLSGVVVGWGARAALGSTREAVVQSLVLAHTARDKVKRLVAEQAEFIEDMLAEGRARFEAQRDAAQIEHDVPPRVVEVRKARKGRAA